MMLIGKLMINKRQLWNQEIKSVSFQHCTEAENMINKTVYVIYSESI